MKRCAIFIILSTFLGCATTNSFYGPNGERIHESNCNGGMRSMASCYNMAHEMCQGRGYVLIEKEKNEQYLDTNPVNGQLVIGSKRSITYICR